MLGVLPLSIIFAAVGPLEDSLALRLVLEEFTLVSATVFISLFAFTMHLVLLPGTGVLTTISPLVGALAVKSIVFQVASV